MRSRWLAANWASLPESGCSSVAKPCSRSIRRSIGSSPGDMSRQTHWRPPGLSPFSLSRGAAGRQRPKTTCRCPNSRSRQRSGRGRSCDRVRRFGRCGRKIILVRVGEWPQARKRSIGAESRCARGAHGSSARLRGIILLTTSGGIYVDVVQLHELVDFARQWVLLELGFDFPGRRSQYDAARLPATVAPECAPVLELTRLRACPGLRGHSPTQHDRVAARCYPCQRFCAVPRHHRPPATAPRRYVAAAPS